MTCVFITHIKRKFSPLLLIANHKLYFPFNLEEHFRFFMFRKLMSFELIPAHLNN